MSSPQTTHDLAAIIAAVRRQAFEEAAHIALDEVVIGNNLLDTEQGASSAAKRIAARLIRRGESTKP